MATNKHIEKICVVAIVIALLISIVFLNGSFFGLEVRSKAMGYEDRLFDTSKVHTIDIIIDDWDAFLTTAQSETYSVCTVVIDGERFANVGIRGKGNTSLSSVATSGSSRYSFKIEFDQYDSTTTYHGLDKLSLNNMIQDNTMMKDYLVYQMMNAFGAEAPLCSYVYITVNGEDWGLYLAVEAVEESFLQRNYGNDYGELYKPDSMNMGGGRGNGMDFNFEDMQDWFGSGTDSESSWPTMPDTGGEGSQTRPSFGGSSATMPDGSNGFDPSQMEGMFPGMSGDFNPEEGFDFTQQGNGMLNFGGMGGSTTLQYIDDQISSYSTIFDSAKTAITTADKNRLIASLKNLTQQTDLENVLDMDSVIRYFVVHNFVVNSDSYTGSMVHNYYLYEEDGRLAMIPWDYNLAFGTFMGGNATSSVNDDIDAPLSVTGFGRPMIDWIFSSEEYTQLYHEYFAQFLETVDVQAIIQQAYELIAPYVEKDPTKFCTTAEFETGVETLQAFCDLRSQSVSAQLAGEEGTVDASSLNISAMGTMSQGMGGGMGDRPSGDREESGDGNGSQFPGGGQMPDGSQFPGGGQMPDGSQFPSGGQMPDGSQFPSGGQMPEGIGNFQPGGSGNGGLTIVLSLAALLFGLIFAFKFKRK